MTVTDFDPATFAPSLDQEFEQASSNAYEAWRDAIDEEAEKHNEYLQVLSLAYLSGGEVAISARKDWSNQQPEVSRALQWWNSAVAQEKRCRAKVDELRERSIRLMAHEKRVAGQT